VKHASWSYQNEWRIINLADNDNIQGILPTAIFLGVKSSKNTRKKLSAISRNIGCNLFLMQGKDQSSSTFELKFSQIL